MPLKGVLEILPLRCAAISKLLAACVLKKQGGRKERRELFIHIDYLSTVLMSCVGIHFLWFLLIIQIFHNILSKKVHLMAFHIWKATYFSLYFPVGNGVVHQERMIWDFKLPDFLLCLLYRSYNSPLGFCSDGWNRFRANL